MSTDLSASARAVPTPREYGEFISQIDLRAIWLKQSEITNNAGLVPPSEARFSIEDQSSWAIEPGVGFSVSITYTVEMRAGATTTMRLRASYELLYSSETAITDEIFEVFKRHNLPVNAWPYLREYVANTLGRFGWSPFTLPAFKVNTPPRAKVNSLPRAEERSSPLAQPSKKRSVARKSRTNAAPTPPE